MKTSLVCFHLSSLMLACLVLSLWLGMNLSRRPGNAQSMPTYIAGYRLDGDAFDPEYKTLTPVEAGWPLTIMTSVLETRILKDKNLELPVQHVVNRYDWRLGIPVNSACGILLASLLAGLWEYIVRVRSRESDGRSLVGEGVSGHERELEEEHHDAADRLK